MAVCKQFSPKTVCFPPSWMPTSKEVSVTPGRGRRIGPESGEVCWGGLPQGSGFSGGFNWLSEFLEISPLALAPSALSTAPSFHSPVELFSSPVFWLTGSADASPTPDSSWPSSPQGHTADSWPRHAPGPPCPLLQICFPALRSWCAVLFQLGGRTLDLLRFLLALSFSFLGF